MDWEEDCPMVCTTHLAFVPCRKGHVGELWGVGCTFSIDSNELALVAAWHRGEIDDPSSSGV